MSIKKTEPYKVSDKFQYGVARITIIEDGKWRVDWKGWGPAQGGMEWGLHNFITASWEDAIDLLKSVISG